MTDNDTNKSMKSSISQFASDLPDSVKFFALPFIIFELLLIPVLNQFTDQNYKFGAFGTFNVLVIIAMFLAYSLLKRTPKSPVETITLPAPTEIEENGNKKRIDYDIFISTAMSGLGDEPIKYAKRASDVKAIVDHIKALREEPALRVFHATAKVTKIGEFEDPAIALRYVVLRMRASSYLAFFYFESVPTSALVEVGMALSLGKPSVWFIKKGVPVPYLMQGTNYMVDNGLPPVRTVNFSDLTDLKRLISEHGKEYFGLIN